MSVINIQAVSEDALPSAVEEVAYREETVVDRSEMHVEGILDVEGDHRQIQPVDPCFLQGRRSPQGRVGMRKIAQDCMQLHGQVGHRGHSG